MFALPEVGHGVYYEFRRDWVLWKPRNDVELRLAIVSCSLERLRCSTELIEVIRRDFESKHDNFFERGLLASLDELGVVACELAPVPEAADESGVTVLKLDERLKQNWQLIDVQEHVDAHLLAFVLIGLIDFQLKVVLHVESVELKVVLIENEAGNVNEGPKMH